MKKLLLLLILNFQFLIFNSSAQSPDWLWAKALSGTSFEYCNSIAIDTSGNGDVYTTGRFNGTIDFDPGPGVFNLTATLNNIFISKLDSSGNFVWVKDMGGTLGGGEGFSIAIDPAGSGNVYITGGFGGTVDFDPGAGIFNLTTVGSEDIFICKLNSSGNFVWAKAIAVAGNTSTGYSIAIDPAGSGDVYTTGQFNGTADFDPGAGVFNLTETGSGDIFISKLDSSGNFVWAKVIGGTSADNGYSIAIDPAGSGAIYTTGISVGTVDFDPGAGVFNLGAAGTEYIFISKLDSSGNFVWAKVMGDGAGASIAIDPVGNGDVYTTGHFVGTVDFDPGAGVFNLTSAGNDIFISKLDSSGNFVWAKAMGGTSYDYGNAIAIDPSGSGAIYTTGSFDGAADFDPGAGVFNLTTTGGTTDIFISKLDSSGNFVWAKAIGGLYWDATYAMAFDASDNMYVTGDFNSPSITFGSTTLNNAGGNYADIFIAKLDTTVVTGINEIENVENVVLVFPNPATSQLEISSRLFAVNNIEIYDVLGQKVFGQKLTANSRQQITIDVSQLNAGIYFLQIQSAEKLQKKKLIVAK